MDTPLVGVSVWRVVYVGVSDYPCLAIRKPLCVASVVSSLSLRTGKDGTYGSTATTTWWGIRLEVRQLPIEGLRVGAICAES